MKNKEEKLSTGLFMSGRLVIVRISFLLLLLLCNVGVVHIFAQQGDDVTFTKTVMPLQPEVNGVVTVTLTLQGEDRICETVTQTPVDVVLVIDTSGSMASGVESILLGLISWGPAKIEEAQKAAKAFVDELTEVTDRVALIAFDSDARLLSSLDNDHAKTQQQIDRLTTNGSTNLHAALEIGHAELTRWENPSVQQVLIILSDGRSDSEQAIAAADAVKAAGIYVISVGVGSNVDQSLMEKIATSPSDYHASATGTDLRDIYISIAQTIKRALGTTNVKVEHTYDTDKISILPASISSDGVLFEPGHVVWEIPTLADVPVVLTYRATILTSGQFFIDTLDTVTYLECEQISQTLKIPPSLHVSVFAPFSAISWCPVPPLTIGGHEVSTCLLLIPVLLLLLVGLLLWLWPRRRPAVGPRASRPDIISGPTPTSRGQTIPTPRPSGAAIQHGKSTSRPTKR